MTSLSRLARLSSIQHGLQALRIIQSTLRCEVPRTSPVLASAQSIDRTISMLKILLKTDFFSPSSSQKAPWPVAHNHAASQTTNDSSNTHRHRVQRLKQRIGQHENTYAQADWKNPASPPSLFSNFSNNPDSFFIPHDTTTNQKTHALPWPSTHEPLNPISGNAQSEPSLHQVRSLFYLPSTLMPEREAEAIAP